MGREVRRVPADWQHPKRADGRYEPLHGRSFIKSLGDWIVAELMWRRGKRSDFNGGWKPREGDELSMAFEEWDGARPVESDYMPEWPECERTHLMMYEDTSEGTPISPAFETPEELARWLADNGASSFGHTTSTYEQWLPTCRGKWAPSLVIANGRMMSGVEFSAERAP